MIFDPRFSCKEILSMSGITWEGLSRALDHVMCFHRLYIYRQCPAAYSPCLTLTYPRVPAGSSKTLLLFIPV